MKKNVIDFSLLVSGIVLFALPQPNFVFTEGLPFLIYIAYVPLFLLAQRLSWKTVWLYGLAYGVGAYCFFTNWLATFHPMGIAVISFLYGIQFALLLPCLKWAHVLFVKYAFLVQWIVWCAYEYLKTQGFAGFHYGLSAYSQWQIAPLIQIASIGGVWALGALLSFTSAWISGVLSPFFATQFSSVKFLKFSKSALIQKICDLRVSIIIWVVVFVASLVYGFVVQKNYDTYEQKKIILIQTNTDPWQGGTVAYTRDLRTLKKLSTVALAEHPDTSFVVWPETAFVPRIRWHYKYRYDRTRFELVQDLLTYINDQSVPFVIGNDDTVQGYTRLGEYGELSYNAVLLFRPRQNVIPPEPEIYHKNHLVPFTEYFPFEKLFPKIYKLLLNHDTHMWTPGSESNVFSIDEFSFGTPICFEDTFGYITRQYAQKGANIIVNISNDAWSKSLACQNQHLSMAVFRSVETRLPSVRATASGQTCVIDPNGAVVAMLDPFTENYLAGTVPVLLETPQTVYTKIGDSVGVFFVCLAIFMFVAGIIITIKKRM